MNGNDKVKVENFYEFKQVVDRLGWLEKKYNETIKTAFDFYKEDHYDDVKVEDLDTATVLAIIPFLRNRELFNRSKRQISKSWFVIEQDIGCMNNFKNKEQLKKSSEPRTDDKVGISVVLSFDYPDDFKDKIEKFIAPIEEHIVRTTRQHFTIANFGRDIPVNKLSQVRNKIQFLFNKIAKSNSPLETLANIQPKIRPEMVVMPDGALVLFASGDLLDWIHELRFEIFKNNFFDDCCQKSHNPSEQPVWMYTVYARTENIPQDKILTMVSNEHFFQENRPACIKNLQLSLMIFKDEKAIGQPDIEPVICSWDFFLKLDKSSLNLDTKRSLIKIKWEEDIPIKSEYYIEESCPECNEKKVYHGSSCSGGGSDICYAFWHVCTSCFYAIHSERTMCYGTGAETEDDSKCPYCGL